MIGFFTTVVSCPEEVAGSLEAAGHLDPSFCSSEAGHRLGAYSQPSAQARTLAWLQRAERSHSVLSPLRSSEAVSHVFVLLATYGNLQREKELSGHLHNECNKGD